MAHNPASLVWKVTSDVIGVMVWLRQYPLKFLADGNGAPDLGGEEGLVEEHEKDSHTIFRDSL